MVGAPIMAAYGRAIIRGGWSQEARIKADWRQDASVCGGWDLVA